MTSTPLGTCGISRGGVDEDAIGAEASCCAHATPAATTNTTPAIWPMYDRRNDPIASPRMHLALEGAKSTGSVRTASYKSLTRSGPDRRMRSWKISRAWDIDWGGEGPRAGEVPLQINTRRMP